MFDSIVPFITDAYTEYDVLVNIYQVLFMYAFISVLFKIFNYLKRSK